MGYDWTDPSSDDLAEEAEIDAMVAAETAAIEQFRIAIVAAHELLRALDLQMHCPIPGYDWRDVRDVLADWVRLPAVGAYQRALDEQATRIVREGV